MITPTKTIIFCIVCIFFNTSIYSEAYQLKATSPSKNMKGELKQEKIYEAEENDLWSRFHSITRDPEAVVFIVFAALFNIFMFRRALLRETIIFQHPNYYEDFHTATAHFNIVKGG